jgi:hypothetical protein
MLRLLALREEGYEDIAALLGLSVDQVRARVKEALAELDSGDSEAPATPPPAPTPAPEPVEPSAPEPAVESAAPARPASETRPRPAAKRGGRGRISVPKDRRRLSELAGGLLVLILLVLFATGAVDIGGGDSDEGSTAQTADSGNRKVTGAILSPPGGGDAIGRAVFGRVGKGPVLQVQAEGLEATPAGESYTVWLYRSPKLALRVGSVKAEKGGIAAQFPVPVELLSYVAGGAFNQIYVSLTDDGSYKAEIAQARRERRLPAYSGETALRGEIVGPLVERRQ